MTVIARRFVATPVRTASAVWQEISDLICGDDVAAATEFSAVNGAVSSVISDEVLQNAPFIVCGTGPRLRVYCLYGEDAVSGEDKNEGTLTWRPTSGSWQAYVPCLADDVAWLSPALQAKSGKFTAYDPAVGLPDDTEDTDQKSQEVSTGGFAINPERFRSR